MTLLRTFVAIELPPPVRQAIDDQVQRLQRCLVTQLPALERTPAILRWTPTDKLHLTLRFLGDTTPAQCAALATDLTAALPLCAFSPLPFTLTLGRLGCFPNWTRPSVLWIGLDGQIATLNALQQCVEESVQRVGFPAETRDFAPHLTISRVDRRLAAPARHALGRAMAACQEQTSPDVMKASPAEISVTEIVHMQSELRPSGARYTPIRHLLLPTNPGG